MSVSLVKEVWDELKRHINAVERAEAADALVSVLIDNDVDADEIKSTFKNDTEVKRAVASYIKDHQDEQEDDDEEDEEDGYVDDEWEDEDEDY